MNYKGFTLIEVIISLSICSVCVVLYTSFLQVMKVNHYELYQSDDSSSIHQMRILFALSKEYSLHGDMLALRYLSKDMEFVFSNQKLVLEDGYQVFFMDLNDAYFKKKESCYYLYYERKDRGQERIIGCE